MTKAVNGDSDQSAPPPKKQKTSPPVVVALKETAQPASNTNGLSYDSLCQVFANIEETTKRLKITDLLVEYFVSCIRYNKLLLNFVKNAS